MNQHQQQQQQDYRPSIPDGTQGTPKSFDNSAPTTDSMSVDQCETVPKMDDSQLVGALVTMSTADLDLANRESLGTLAVVDVRDDVKPAAEISTGKRKRGRPPKVQGKSGLPQAPPASSSQRKKKDEEDVCFICFDGGSLVLCDRRGCPKAYHPACIKRDEAFFRSKAKWNCGWHICSSCQKASYYMCYTCPFSLCKGCTKDADYSCVRGNKGFCGTCMRTIMLIENIALGNQETVQVDFDDKTSWEYLFKVYWVYLKAKLSLTSDELTKAKNPWKGDELPKAKNFWQGACAVVPKQEPSCEFYHSNYNNGTLSDSCCGNLKTVLSKRRKLEDQPNVLNEKNPPGTEKSHVDQITQMPEGTLWATKELIEFVAHMKNGDVSVLSQFDVQGLLLEYIKRHDLCDPCQKTHIVCDSRLIKLFGKERVGHFEMLKLLEYHLFTNEKLLAEEPSVMGVAKVADCLVNAAGYSDCQFTTGTDKKHKTRKKTDEGEPHIKPYPEEYAAIDVHNINLLFLKHSLLEILMDDAAKFHEKVVGSFVRIRISGGDQKQDMYRLVQVVGTSKAAESYKVGTKTTDFMLEILNLDKTEVVSIDGISNQDFLEDECKRLRQSIKCGLMKRLRVGEIQERAMALQAVKVSDDLEAEILRLNHLRDRASETGCRKELRECVEKLELLKSSEERQRRLLEVPNVHADPNMIPSYESEEDAGESDIKIQGDSVRTENPVGIKGTELNSSRREGDDLSDIGNQAQNSATTSDGSRGICTTFYVDRDGTTLVHERVSQAKCGQGGEQTDVNSKNMPKNWLDSTGSVTVDLNRQAVVPSDSFSGVASPVLPPLPTGKELSVDIETDKLWHYRDPSGKIQGPFPMAQLRKWSTSMLFPHDLRVWKMNEKPDDSILLTDALVGRFHKEPALPPNSYLQAQEVTVAFDKDRRHESGSRSSTDSAQVDDSKKVDQSWKSVQNDGSIDCNGNYELFRSKGWGAHSSSWPPAANVTIPDNGQAQPALQLWELSRGGKTWSDQSHVCSSLSSDPSSGKLGETQLLKVREDHEYAKQGFDRSDVKGYSLQTHEGQNNVDKCDDKQADSESYSNQSSGQNWRPPIKSSSSGWDSKSAFFSAAKTIETSQKNEEIDFFDLLSPTLKQQHHEDLKSHAAENNHSKLPLLDSGLSWSTASSLVVGGAQITGVSSDWGGYSPAPVKPSVEEWDSNHVSGTSRKPTDGSSDHAATPTPDSGPLTNSPPIHPVIDATGWQPMVPEPTEFCSLVDESVSDLLAEVEAMESLGLPSPTSKLRSAEELTRGYDDDCFSPVEGFSPAPDPGKSDAFSSTADVQIPPQLTLVSEQLKLCHMPSQPTVMDKPLGVSLMPSQWTLADESLRMSHTPSQSTITDEPLAKFRTDEPLGLYHTDISNPQKSFSGHSSTSPGVEGNTKTVDVSINQRDKGSEIQLPSSSASNQGESCPDIQPTASTVTRWEAGSDIQQPTLSDKDASRGTVKGRAMRGNTNMVLGNGHGIVQQQHTRMNPVSATGNPGLWGSQPRHGGDRVSSQRDHHHRNHFQSRDRDSGFGRDSRSSWNKQYGVGNGLSTHRPPPKGQRVCKFYESGYCKKGASCSYWHP